MRFSNFKGIGIKLFHVHIYTQHRKIHFIGAPPLPQPGLELKTYGNPTLIAVSGHRSYHSVIQGRKKTFFRRRTDPRYILFPCFAITHFIPMYYRHIFIRNEQFLRSGFYECFDSCMQQIVS